MGTSSALAPVKSIPAVNDEGPASWLRGLAYRMLLFGCRASGAAFIKWGQWASSRPDMLPEVCMPHQRPHQHSLDTI